MLGSEQPGEAEAARRKLLDHLGHHRLSLTDLAIRLRDSASVGAGGSGRGNGASFTQGAREMSLERQLSIARGAKLEAESEGRRARIQVAELQQSLQQAAFDVGRLLRAQARARLLAALGWIAAAIAGAMVLLLLMRHPIEAPATARVSPRTFASIRAQDREEGDAVLRLAPGEHYGTVMVQDLPVRLNPNDDAGIRAFLNRGMRVVIEQQVRVGVQSWLLIRSVTGSGWVRGGDVGH